MSKLSKLWFGLTAVFAVLLCIAVVGTTVAYDYAGVINDALGVQTSKVIKGEVSEEVDTTYYKSSFGEFNAANLEKLKEARKEQNINEMREGAALLKNDKNALPLKTEKKISLFGRSAAYPVWQGSAAGTKVSNTTADKTDLKTALEKEGFTVNPNSLEGYKVVGNGSDGNKGGHDKAGTGTGEESPDFYDAKIASVGEYTDAAIVVLSRVGAEGTDVAMSETDDDGTTVLSGLALHSNEREMLKKVRAAFGKVIVLLNIGNQMEVEEVKQYCDAMLYMGLPGNYGFEGVAEILSGKVNPSGHLADTYAVNSLSAPAVVNSGTQTPEFINKDAINEQIGAAENASWISFQAESVYIGYRYYETRYADAVAGVGNAKDKVGASKSDATEWKYSDEISYPFGYGMSYTTFTQTLDSVSVGADTIEVKVTVKNTGSVKGKSVVQVYAQTPYGDYEKKNKVEKSAIQLVGFAKTKELDANATDTVTVTVDKYLLASYDYVGEKGYILSGGDYYIAIGDNVHDALNNVLAKQGKTGMTDENGAAVTGTAAKAHEFSQSFDANKYRMSTNNVRVTNQFDDCDLNHFIENGGKYLSRSDWKATYPTQQTTVAATAEMIKLLSGNTYETPKDAPKYEELAAQFGKDEGLNIIMMRDVPLSDKITWRKFIMQLKIEDLPLATAESFSCPAVGSLSPAFAVGDGDDSVGSTIRIYPQSGTTKPKTDENGVAIETSKDPGVISWATLRYCSKPTLTGTFNEELYAGRGKMMGEEGLWANLMENYNTGADLHRTPFGGRAFEYMSECPNLSYLASIPEVTAMEKTGSHAAPKHAVGNDQEYHREGVACFFTEQALREGNLRAFEGALKVAKAGGLMQSFERLGCTWASASYAMNTQVFRNEWGWTGNIVTDAAPLRGGASGFKGYKNHALEVLAAGSEQFCLDGSAGHGKEALAWAKENNDGNIVELLINAAISWEYAIAHSGIVNGISSADRIVQVTPWWQTTLIAVIVVLSVLTAAALALSVVSKVLKKKEA